MLLIVAEFVNLHFSIKEYLGNRLFTQLTCFFCSLFEGTQKSEKIDPRLGMENSDMDFFVPHTFVTAKNLIST
jgi:hypothetical protein